MTLGNSGDSSSAHYCNRRVIVIVPKQLAVLPTIRFPVAGDDDAVIVDGVQTADVRFFTADVPAELRPPSIAEIVMFCRKVASWTKQPVNVASAASSTGMLCLLVAPRIVHLTNAITLLCAYALLRSRVSVMQLSSVVKSVYPPLCAYPNDPLRVSTNASVSDSSAPLLSLSVEDLLTSLRLASTHGLLDFDHVLHERYAPTSPLVAAVLPPPTVPMSPGAAGSNRENFTSVELRNGRASTAQRQPGSHRAAVVRPGPSSQPIASFDAEALLPPSRRSSWLLTFNREATSPGGGNALDSAGRRRGLPCVTLHRFHAHARSSALPSVRRGGVSPTAASSVRSAAVAARSRAAESVESVLAVVKAQRASDCIALVPTTLDGSSDAPAEDVIKLLQEVLFDHNVRLTILPVSTKEDACPADDVVEGFMTALDTALGAAVVLSWEDLAPSLTLFACILIREGFSAAAAIGWLRICTQCSLAPNQVFYLEANCGRLRHLAQKTGPLPTARAKTASDATNSVRYIACWRGGDFNKGIAPVSPTRNPVVISKPRGQGVRPVLALLTSGADAVVFPTGNTGTKSAFRVGSAGSSRQASLGVPLPPHNPSRPSTSSKSKQKWPSSNSHRDSRPSTAGATFRGTVSVDNLTLNRRAAKLGTANHATLADPRQFGEFGSSKGARNNKYIFRTAVSPWPSAPAAEAKDDVTARGEHRDERGSSLDATFTAAMMLQAHSVLPRTRQPEVSEPVTVCIVPPSQPLSNSLQQTDVAPDAPAAELVSIPKPSWS